jgi:hypothetical protein
LVGLTEAAQGVMSGAVLACQFTVASARTVNPLTASSKPPASKEKALNLEVISN